MAAQLSEVIGRKITHVHSTVDELKEHYLRIGLSEPYAVFLAGLDLDISRGSEEKHWDAPNTIHGKIRIREFFEKNKDAFQK